MDAQDAQDATEEHIYECALAALLAEDSTAADVRPTLQKFCDSPQALEEAVKQLLPLPALMQLNSLLPECDAARVAERSVSGHVSACSDTRHTRVR